MRIVSKYRLETARYAAVGRRPSPSSARPSTMISRVELESPDGTNVVVAADSTPERRLTSSISRSVNRRRAASSPYVASGSTVRIVMTPLGS